MASRIDWHRLKRSTIAIESVHAALALAALATGWMTFPLLLLLVCAELAGTVVLSGWFFRERGWSRHVVDVLKALAACGFCAIFLLAAYAGAGGFGHGPVIDVRGFGVLVLLAGGRLLMIAVSARRSGEPRLHWTREALLRGGALLIGMFLAIFACFIPGIPLAGLLRLAWPEVAADIAIGGVLLLIQGGLACVLSTMTDHELADIAQNPYLD